MPQQTQPIKTFETLLHLVRQDEGEHIIKELALLLLSALRDWPSDNTLIIADGIAEFKVYFGYPFTIVNGRLKEMMTAPYWSWRGESGAALLQMIELAKQHLQMEDFDAIVEKVLAFYAAKNAG